MITTIIKFIRFLAVGLSGMIIDFSITFICKEKIKLNKYVANSIAFCIAQVWNFYWNKHYTFNKDVHCRDLFQTQCMLESDPITNHPVCDSMICFDFSIDEVAAKVLEMIR